MGELQRTKIDRLALSVVDPKCRAVPGFFDSVFGHLGAVDYEDRAGAHGFTAASLISVDGAQVAWWGWGGSSQKGRSYVDVSGLGCQLIRDWGSAVGAVNELPDVRAKRIDIAADFYRGEVRYEDVLHAYRRGKFCRSGRPPKMSQIVPGDVNEGRTCYIGRRGNDLMLRAYEKGKKEFGGLPPEMRSFGVEAVNGEDDDGKPFKLVDWVRVELELRGSKRELPLSVIGERDSYFAGAYPYLQEVLPDIDPQILVSVEHVAAAELSKALQNIRRQYGSTLFTALAVYEGDLFEVWKRIKGDGHNERLVSAGVLLMRDQIQTITAEAFGGIEHDV